MSSPRIGFVIGGVQKGGTTALAHFLGRHSGLALPHGKEAHVFDAPDFNEDWAPTQVDARYEMHFGPALPGVLHGDATPLYCFHPMLVRRIATYNPAMRWILLLRHPVERAVSHYRMEYGRGDESWSFWPAMLLERWRLRGHEDDFSIGSPLRHHSYRARGDYARQLDVLYAHFPADQVLLLRNEALAQAPEQTLQRICQFLGVEPLTAEESYGRVFEGGYPALRRDGFRFSVLRWLMAREMRRAQRHYGLDWR